MLQFFQVLVLIIAGLEQFQLLELIEQASSYLWYLYFTIKMHNLTKKPSSHQNVWIFARSRRGFLPEISEKLNDRSLAGFCYLISRFPFSKTKYVIFPEKQNRSPVYPVTKVPKLQLISKKLARWIRQSSENCVDNSNLGNFEPYTKTP